MKVHVRPRLRDRWPAVVPCRPRSRRRVRVVAVLGLLAVASCSETTDPGPSEPPPPPPPLPELDGQWDQVARLPERVQELHGAVLGGRIYVAGGIASGDVTSARAYRYDPVANQWERIADLPSPRHHMPVVVARDSLYAIGGFGPQGFDAQNNFWLYLEDSNEWTARTSAPTTRGASAAVQVDGKIYVMGGYTFGNELVSLVDVYDPGTDQWTRVAPLPTPLDHLAAAAVDGRIYVTGGRTIFLGSTHDLVQRYDPAEDRWDLVAALPAPTAGHAAVAMDGRVHVLGGEGPGQVFNYHFAYDPDSNVWSANYAQLPTARHGLAAAVVGGRLYAIGGGPVAGFSQTDVVEAFDPE
jgi:N-acetylneuraminic acid mutarotase